MEVKSTGMRYSRKTSALIPREGRRNAVSMRIPIKVSKSSIVRSEEVEDS